MLKNFIATKNDLKFWIYIYLASFHSTICTLFKRSTVEMILNIFLHSKTLLGRFKSFVVLIFLIDLIVCFSIPQISLQMRKRSQEVTEVTWKTMAKHQVFGANNIDSIYSSSKDGRRFCTLHNYYIYFILFCKLSARYMDHHMVNNVISVIKQYLNYWNFLFIATEKFCST